MTAVATALTAALAACGGTDTTTSGGPATSSTPGATAVCQGTTAKPGYTNGLHVQPNQATTLSGAGSTFVAPMLSAWSSTYAQQKSVQVAYQSIGSGGGIAQIDAGTVDFGDSDAYMKDTDIAKAKGPILQVPLVLAPVVVTYNLQGVSKGLKLDGETIGKIFAGVITTWNDPAITAQNPGITLPSSPIATVHRSDGSGTTDIFTDYLTKESPTWVSTLGGANKSRGKTVAWPNGIGGKGNEGVSGAVQQTPGAIGYVELAYALTQNLPYADVKNKAGSYIEPCIKTVLNATNGVTYPDDLRIDLTDASDPQAYPITGTTWALIYQNQTDAAKAAALVNFFSWVLTTGQDQTIALNYTPLGKDLQQRCLAQLKKMTLNGSPVVP
ncbi:MAG: phosphate ABC transporter substrate-binding protein PstS [Candidatus Dormibacteraeota bacterium]|uniref:Phosphate-binding protein n=1 Tax=Candidatus Aeolococcus gillhamiae TaxID=3127015 RepID=A0A934K3M2_9BACT|nr:phosphate ABC transporter substrate-binding protein PstS [Candidatus Dormibacteraeota bacterium]